MTDLPSTGNVRPKIVRDLGPQEVTFCVEQPGMLSVNIGGSQSSGPTRYKFEIDTITIDIHGKNGPMLYGRSNLDAKKGLLVGPLGLSQLKSLRELGVWFPLFSAH